MSTDAGVNASPLVKEFTSWKFGLIDAMLSDPELSSADVRVAIAVLQCVNKFTRVAVLTDSRLQQLVPRDRKAFQVARARLVELGWWKVLTGRSGRATEYRFIDERAKRLMNFRLDARILAREKESDNEMKSLRKKQGNKAEPPCNENPLSEEKSPHNALGAKTPHSGARRGEISPQSGEKSHPLHLQTPRDSLPEKGRVSTHTYDEHVHAYDHWGRFEETAGRLEHDEGLPREEAERHARVLCGFGGAGTEGVQNAADARMIVASRELRRNRR